MLTGLVIDSDALYTALIALRIASDLGCTNATSELDRLQANFYGHFVIADVAIFTITERKAAPLETLSILAHEDLIASIGKEGEAHRTLP